MDNNGLAVNFCRDGYVNLTMAYMSTCKEALSDHMSQYVPMASRCGHSIFIGAFACEQLLKCLLLFESTDFKRIHKLDDLFDLLSDVKRNEIEGLWNNNHTIEKTHGTPPNETPLNFMEHLSFISSDFVSYRYCDSDAMKYRIEQGMTSPLIVVEISRAILNAINDWSDLISPNTAFPEFVIH